MPLTKGFILLAYFAITCGILAAVNATLLTRVAQLPEGVLSLALAVALAVLESLGLLALVDRLFLRPRAAARVGQPSRDGGELIEGDGVKKGDAGVGRRSAETSN